MHSGFVIVSGLNKALEYDVPYTARFLEERRIKSAHLSTRKLQRAAIKQGQLLDNGDYLYGTMVADPWQEKRKLREQLFDESLIARQIKIRYLDIPELHEFGEEGHKFFETLASPRCDIQIFEVETIQIIITHKWNLISFFIKYMMFAPYLALLITNLIWHINYRPFRK